MSYNSRSSSAIRSSQSGNSRPRGDRTSRKERAFCTHGVPKAQCKKRHREDDGSATAENAMD